MVVRQLAYHANSMVYRKNGFIPPRLLTAIHRGQFMTQQTEADARRAGDHACEIVHESEREWETLRFDGTESKMLFHPRPERPLEPNAGLVRYAPGSSFPVHRHDFAQVWYILEGQFTIGGKKCGPGTMIFHDAPHYEEEMHTETGGVWLLVQYPGPKTGKPAIYEGRFNMKKRIPIGQERLDY